ncbi:hypothetical protein KEM48_004153 [Puccinia striiformis f. sp. tritici PST-130]|nr:hypothetical protein KEM48_004153 [Puccinia striiformis f. sp. tritici PST-130]
MDAQELYPMYLDGNSARASSCGPSPAHYSPDPTAGAGNKQIGKNHSTNLSQHQGEQNNTRITNGVEMSRLTRTRSAIQFPQTQSQDTDSNPQQQQQSTSQASGSSTTASRPIRMIKTRSMSSNANMKTQTIAFGGHVPPKQSSKLKPPPTKRNAKGTRSTKLDHANVQPDPSLSHQAASTTCQASPKPIVVIPSLTQSASTSASTSPAPTVMAPSIPPQTTLSTSQVAPEPIVVIPSHPGHTSSKVSRKLPASGARPPPGEPPKASCSDPSTLPPAVSLNPPSHSNRPRLIPPAKANKDRPRKRLFEDVDNSSNDIFSFLDHKPRPKKLTKPATRPVFKPSQPIFPKTTRITTEAEGTKTKQRVSASNKLLAGAQPQAKKNKKTHPAPSAITTEFQAPEVHIEKPALEQDFQAQKLPACDHEAQHVSNPLAIPTTKPNEEKDTFIPQPITLTSSAADQPASILKNEQIPTTQDSRSLPPVETSSGTNLSLNSNLPPTNKITPVKRAFEATSTNPFPPKPSTRPASSLDPSSNQTEETSADAIDFLSPRKKQKRSPQPEPDPQKADSQTHPDSNPQTDRCTGPEQTPTDIHPSTTANHTGSQDPCDTNDDRGSKNQTHDTEPPIEAPQSPIEASLDAQALSDDESPPSPFSSPLTELSELSILRNLPPDSPTQTMKNSHTEAPLAGSISDPTEPVVNSNVVMSTSVCQDISPPPVRATTPEPIVELKSTTPKPSPKFIPTRTSPIKFSTLPTSIPIMSPQSSNPSEAPSADMCANLASTSQLLIEEASKRPSMLPRRALKPSMGTGQPMTFNVIPSLDAIIENSPEKKPVRDALSAASLNRPRGFGAPSRMFYGAGMKSKAEGIFSRPTVGSKVYLPGPSGGPSSIKPHSELFKAAEQHQSQTEGSASELENQIKSQQEATLEEDDASVDTSTTSIATQQSSSTDSSMTSSGEPNQPQFFGNISSDTKDRLNKLKNMLTKMRPEHASTTGHDQRQQSRHRDSEVPLKDDTSESRVNRSTATTTTTSSRARRRSSSVPLNYCEDDNLSKSTSRSQNPSIRAATKAVPPAQRRVSNILPSVRLDASSPTPGSSSSKTGLSASCSASSGLNHLNNCSTTPASTSTTDRQNKKLISPLKNVVAFVDVRTAEGDDAGKVFVEMLKALGAKVVGRPVFPLTHIIFKAGKPTTIEKYMIHPRPKPALVGIGWVVRCREIMSRAEEKPYTIDLSSAQVIPFYNTENHRSPNISTHPINSSGPINTHNGNSAHNRRKSMEPKALSLLNSGLQLNHTSSSTSSSNTTSSSSIPDSSSGSQNSLSKSCIGKPMSTDPINSQVIETTPDQVIAQSIERARRKSLQFLPKVGSPLARKVSNTLNQRSDEEEDPEPEGARHSPKPPASPVS